MSDAETVTRAQPPVTPLTEPFWEATREQQLLLQHCDVHDHAVF
jgi:hypothetical protein